MSKRNLKVTGMFVFVLAIAFALQIQAQSSNDWVRVRNGNTPNDAVVGGQERNGQETYVCRARHNGGYYSGRLEGDRCYFNPNSREISARRYEVLTGKYYWKRNQNSRYSVIAGSNDLENFYVCRVNASGGTYPGRTEDGRCYYSRQNRGYSSSRYETLQGTRAVITITDAASRGDYREVKDAIDNGQAINLRDSNGRTALMLAAEKGYDRVIQELLYERAGIDYRDQNGNTALMLAAGNGRTTIVRDLMRARADINVRNTEGDTAFTLAASGGHASIVEDFLRDESFGGISQIDAERGFRNAAYFGHTDVLSSLINYGVNVESPDAYGKTALMNAAAGGRVESVRFLLNNDANINAIDDTRSWTPFLYAVESNSQSVLQIFFDEKQSIRADDVDAEKGLFIAAENDKRKSLKYLLLKGVNVNSVSNDLGWTATMLAARMGHDDALEILIKSNANLNEKNNLGETALMLAAANSKNNTTKMLVKAGANLNLRDNNGMTALGRAIQNKHKDTRKTLQKAKAKQ